MIIIKCEEIITLTFKYFGENVEVSFEKICKYINNISAKLFSSPFTIYYSFGELVNLVKNNPDIFCENNFYFKCINLKKAEKLFLKNTSKLFIHKLKKFEKDLVI